MVFSWPLSAHLTLLRIFQAHLSFSQLPFQPSGRRTIGSSLVWWGKNIWGINPVIGLPHWLRGKESTRNAGDVGSIPGSGRSPGGGHGYPLLYPCLKNPMDRGAWWLQSVGTQWVGHDWSNLAGTQFCNNQARLQLMAPPPSLPPNSTFLIWGHYPDSDIYLPTSGLNLKSFWINFLND